MRAQNLELLAELVVEMTVGRAERGPSERHLIGDSPVLEPFARRQRTHTDQVPAPHRIVEVHPRTETIFAGVRVAGIVRVDAARDRSAG